MTVPRSGKARLFVRLLARLLLGASVPALSCLYLLVAAEVAGAWTVSGSIKADNDASTPTQDATVTLTPGDLSGQTDVNGNYTINDVPNGSYTATPAKAGCAFYPQSKPVTVDGANVGNVDFEHVPVDQDPISAADWSLFGKRYGAWSDLRWMDAAAPGGLHVWQNNKEVAISHRHDATHCHTGGGAAVNHSHFKCDYDDSNSVSVDDDTDPPSKNRGEWYWDWYYAGWGPGTIAGTHPNGGAIGGGAQTPTVTRNCHAYAYDGYKANAVATYWVHLPNVAGYLAELDEKCVSPADCSKYDAIDDDRCTSWGHNHSWVLTTTGNPGPATVTTWKMGTSGIYVCTHAVLPTNCGPLGPVGVESPLYDFKKWAGETSFGIYRR